MSGAHLLNDLQALLARINDATVPLVVSDFHLAERWRCAALLGRALSEDEDEKLLLEEGAKESALSVYIDERVLERLRRCDPMQQLDDENLADFCAAMEGVSHFHYLIWCVTHGRQLSLLELELQAEVDKYSVAVCLLRQQGSTDLPRGLRRRLFDQVRFVDGHSAATRQRYQEANRHAACFCERLELRYFGRRRFQPEAWLRTLREFYRRPHHQKMRFALQ